MHITIDFIFEGALEWIKPSVFIGTFNFRMPVLLVAANKHVFKFSYKMCLIANTLAQPDNIKPIFHQNSFNIRYPVLFARFVL